MCAHLLIRIFTQIYIYHILFFRILQYLLKKFFEKFYIFAKNHIFSGVSAFFRKNMHLPKNIVLGKCIIIFHQSSSNWLSIITPVSDSSERSMEALFPLLNISFSRTSAAILSFAALSVYFSNLRRYFPSHTIRML